MRILILHIAFIIGTSTLFAQHIKIDKKELSFLRNEQTINVVFKYDNIKRGGEYISELKYIENRKIKLSLKGKDTIAWIEAYTKSKQNLWQEAYVKHLNKTLHKYKAPLFKIDPSKSTNYSMIVDVVWIYSGYDVGIGRSPAKIKLILTFVDNKVRRKRTNIIVPETFGGNNDNDNDSHWPHLKRVENAFYNSGFKLGIAIKRVFDKK